VLQVQQLISTTVEQLGGVDIMVANAGRLLGLLAAAALLL